MNRFQRVQILALLFASPLVLFGFLYGFTNQSVYADFIGIYIVAYLAGFILMARRLRGYVKASDES